MHARGITAPGLSGATRARPTAVLVVESTEAGSTLATALRQRGWEVLLCYTGMHALASVERQGWDALVIGFRLLDMRGDAVFYAAWAKRPELANRTLLLTTDSVGVEAAAAAHCASLPTETLTDDIVSRLMQLIQDASAS